MSELAPCYPAANPLLTPVRATRIFQRALCTTVTTTAQGTPPSCLSLFVTRFSPRHAYVLLSVSLCCTHTPSHTGERMYERRHAGLRSLHRPAPISILLSLSLSPSSPLCSIQVTPSTARLRDGAEVCRAPPNRRNGSFAY